MSTFFGRPDVQYKLPKDDGDIEIPDFLDSCNGIVEFVSFFGTAFIPVKNDIQGNIQKIRTSYQESPSKYATARSIIESEFSTWPEKMGFVTDALLWLKRALEFNYNFLDQFVADHRSGQPSDSLVKIAQTSYERTLTKHHNFIQRGIFSVIIHATPWRKDFLRAMSLGRPDAEEQAISELELYLPVMKANMDALIDLYHAKGLEAYDSAQFHSNPSEQNN